MTKDLALITTIEKPTVLRFSYLLLATVRPYVQDLKLGAPADREALSKTLAPLFSDASNFGVDLISAGLSDRVLDAFVSMLYGPGAVADTLAALTAQF